MIFSYGNDRTLGKFYDFIVIWCIQHVLQTTAALIYACSQC